MSLIDKFASKVQNYSGETERQELVEDFKNLLDVYKANMHQKVIMLNNVIKHYNSIIERLNLVRSIKFNENLTKLHQFLNSFGHLKSRDSYSDEHSKDIFNLPNHAFKNEEDYLNEINLTKEEIFNSSFKKGIFGTKKDNREKNLEMRESIGEYQLKFETQKYELQIEIDNTAVQQDIAQFYADTVHTVSDVIEQKVVPELELAQAFLEAEEIKNHLIGNVEVPQQLQTPNISLLQDTLYHHHYQFVKNTFLYYVLSEKIYSTPVLTKLLNKQGDTQDLLLLQRQQEQISAQEEKLQTIATVQKKRRFHE